MILTSADYKPSNGVARINHWVPAVSLSNVGETRLQALMALGKCTSDLKVAGLEAERTSLQDQLSSALRGASMDSAKAKETLALLVSTDEALEQAKAWEDFRQRCAAANLHPVEVPGDGNCLLWALHCMSQEIYNWDHDDEHAGISTTCESDILALKVMRQDLAEAWRFLRGVAVWENLFKVMIADGYEEPTTPKRPGKSKPETSPATPAEKVAWKKQKAAVQTIKKHNKAPAWKSSVPPLPDFVGKSAKTAKKMEVKAEVDEVELEVPDAEGEHGEDVVVQVSRRVRTCKKKRKTTKEKRLMNLRNYLAEIGATYAIWQSNHWKLTGSKKAGRCKHGLWTDLLQAIEAHKMPSDPCQACQNVLELFDFSHDVAEKWMSGREILAADEDKSPTADVDELANVKDGPPPLMDEAEKEEEEDLTPEALLRSIDMYCEAGWKAFPFVLNIR